MQLPEKSLYSLPVFVKLPSISVENHNQGASLHRVRPSFVHCFLLQTLCNKAHRLVDLHVPVRTRPYLIGTTQ
jgi:hypothetical protein